jgi:hypothetical protein
MKDTKEYKSLEGIAIKVDENSQIDEVIGNDADDFQLERMDYNQVLLRIRDVTVTLYTTKAHIKMICEDDLGSIVLEEK